MQPETNASWVLVEIDLGSDQAGEDKLAGYSKLSDQRQQMNDRRDTYLFGRRGTCVMTYTLQCIVTVCVASRKVAACKNCKAPLQQSQKVLNRAIYVTKTKTRTKLLPFVLGDQEFLSLRKTKTKPSKNSSKLNKRQ